MARTGKQIVKIVGWIVLAILLISIGAGIFVYIKAENYINQNLAQIVTEKSDSLYNFSFNTIEIRLNPLSLVISDVNFFPDKQRSQKIIENLPATVFYSFQSPEIK